MRWFFRAAAAVLASFRRHLGAENLDECGQLTAREVAAARELKRRCLMRRYWPDGSEGGDEDK
jgi:muconolactone delta-isomerase